MYTNYKKGKGILILDTKVGSELINLQGVAVNSTHGQLDTCVELTLNHLQALIGDNVINPAVGCQPAIIFRQA